MGGRFTRILGFRRSSFQNLFFLRKKTQNNFLRSQSILTNGLKTKRERNLETLGDPVLLGEKEGIKKKTRSKRKRESGDRSRKGRREKKRIRETREREREKRKAVKSLLKIFWKFALDFLYTAL